MNYEVFSTSSFTDFESVAVGLLGHYPSNDPNEHLFCQFQVVRSPKGLHIRVLAFEVNTKPDSNIVIYLEGNKTQIRVEGKADGRFFGADGMAAKWLTGGDNQGDFWGISLLISESVLEELLIDNSFLGNVSKYRDGKMDCSLFSQNVGKFHILQ